MVLISQCRATFFAHGTGGGKAIPVQVWTDPEGSRRFQDNRHMKVIRLSALSTGCLYPPGNIPDIHVCLKLSQPQDHSAVGRIMSIKNSNYTIRN
jgi:hypothetical protein